MLIHQCGSSWRIIMVGHDDAHDEPLWFVMMHHDDSYWFNVMIHHKSWWRVIIVNHQCDSWWLIMMNHDDWNHIRTILGSFWDHIGMILGSFLDHLGTIWDNFRIMFGSSWDHLGTIWDHCWIVLGLSWDDLGIISEPFRHHFGDMLGSHWDHFGTILGTMLELIWDLMGNMLGHIGTIVISTTHENQTDKWIRRHQDLPWKYIYKGINIMSIDKEMDYKYYKVHEPTMKLLLKVFEWAPVKGGVLTCNIQVQHEHEMSIATSGSATWAYRQQFTQAGVGGRWERPESEDQVCSWGHWQI